MLETCVWRWVGFNMPLQYLRSGGIHVGRLTFKSKAYYVHEDTPTAFKAIRYSFALRFTCFISYKELIHRNIFIFCIWILIFSCFLPPETKAREITPQFWLHIADTTGYILTLMLWMCVSPFGCQATTVDNVPCCNRGFLSLLCLWDTVCFVLDTFLQDHQAKGVRTKPRNNLKSIRSPLEVVWLSGS